MLIHLQQDYANPAANKQIHVLIHNYMYIIAQKKKKIYPPSLCHKTEL